MNRFYSQGNFANCNSNFLTQISTQINSMMVRTVIKLKVLMGLLTLKSRLKIYSYLLHFEWEKCAACSVLTMQAIFFAGFFLVVLH